MNTRSSGSGTPDPGNDVGPPWVIYAHDDISQEYVNSLIDEASHSGHAITVKVAKLSTQTEVVHHVLARSLDRGVTVTFETMPGSDE